MCFFFCNGNILVLVDAIHYTVERLVGFATGQGVFGGYQLDMVRVFAMPAFLYYADICHKRTTLDEDVPLRLHLSSGRSVRLYPQDKQDRKIIRHTNVK